jgi:carbonic anhydrase
MRITTTTSSHFLVGFAATALLSVVAGRSAPAEPPAAAATTQPAPTMMPSATPAPADPVWHYDGANGPANWGKLSPKFAACGTGKAQSPIDLVSPTSAKDAAPLTLRVPPAVLRIAHHEHVADGINNGHTVQINYAGGDTLKLGDQSFALLQYHFHNPSEHTVGGKHSAMEIHLVHKSAANALAVVGVSIEEGAHNAAFDPIWSNLPKQKGQETHYPSVKVDVDALLPSVRSAYRYDGSLTTPPCSEGVKWVVLSSPIQLSRAQIQTFTQLIHDNNRPTQPLNGRIVSSDTVAVAAR